LETKHFKHLRVGIGYDQQFSLSNWVLGEFTNEEKQKKTTILPTLLTSLEEWIQGNDWGKIMNVYNRKKPQ
jgi:PTH1 family peptidyl-tRNA hydrolase